MVRPLPGLLILPIVWIAAAAGRRINRAICPALADNSVEGAERSILGLGTGLALLALGVLALGLLGLLSPVPVAGWCALVAIIGWREHIELLADVGTALSASRRSPYLSIGAAIVGLAALGACFVPPTSFEWDSLSYHLADPKLYVASHRIYYLPWESHSNFAFNMEMLYSIGMLAHSIALAKLFNFALAAIGAVAVYRLATRIANPAVGTAALAIYITLPLVFWEAGTAYVDLAATSYAALALLALSLMARTGDRRFAFVAGVLLGGMLGIKATALVTIGLYCFGIVAHARMARSSIPGALRTAVVMGLIAVLVGSPWYVKSAVYTGNPFYPFAYSIFGGRYWSEANAIPYAAAQYSFGDGHSLLSLLLIPWNLTMYLVPQLVTLHAMPPSVMHPFNDNSSVLFSYTPLFLICAIAALVTPLKPGRGVRLMTGYVVVSLIIWFYLTQQVRYFLPVTPVLCILSAWTLSEIAKRSKVGVAAAGVAICIAVAFNVFVLAQYSASMWRVALDPSGQEAYVAANLDSYSAMQFLNTATPATAKAICYGEPRTFYLDRGHMWGDLGSEPLYPPYAQLGSPEALRDWLTARGYRYILINTNGTHLTPTKGWAGKVYALTLGSGRAPVFQDHGTVVYAI